MTPVAQIVTRALRLVGVQDAAESPSAVDMASGIAALNALCARIEADGVPLGWSAVALPSDAMPTPVEMDEPLVYLLASRLADEYRVPLSPVVMQRAEAGLGKLHADSLGVDAARIEYELPGSTGMSRLAGFLRG